KETLYTLGHDSIRQFLVEDEYWQGRLTGANWELAKRTVRGFGSDWSAVDPFDPVQRYLLFHLLDHATGVELEQLLAAMTLANACEVHADALFDQHAFGPSLQAHDIILRLRKAQVEHQGRRDLRNALALAYMKRGCVLLELGRPEDALAEHERGVRLLE